MNKVAQYLQEHLQGEVTSDLDVRRYFATDASILTITPSVVVYPRGENDIRKAARFSWQLAERGQILPITARGGGSDTSGAAIGSGVMLVFTAHMNRLLTFSLKKRLAVVEPGLTYDNLERILQSHSLSLPPQPGSAVQATIAGGIANNAIGHKSVKYGATGNYVESLRVVLANGEVIETGPLSKRELSHKLGLSTLEGQIYRSLDTLLEESAELVRGGTPNIKALHNATGYNIFDVRKNGHFDLTPLFIGSQGTLGIITEATLRLEAHNPSTTLAMISLDSLDTLNEILPKILELNPSALDMINRGVVEQVKALNPNLFGDSLQHPLAAIHLFVEFDNFKEADQKRLLKNLKRIVGRVGGEFQSATDEETKQKIWQIRQSVSTILRESTGQSQAVPVAEDISLPSDRLAEFMSEVTKIYQLVGLEPAMWGQAGSGVVRIQPFLDLAEVGDRQKLFKLTEHIYKTAIGMDGSTSAAAGDGRVRSSYTQELYGEKLYGLMMQVKQIFDPRGILNPGVKTASLDDVKALMREEYGSKHYEHLLKS